MVQEFKKEKSVILSQSGAFGQTIVLFHLLVFIFID